MTTSLIFAEKNYYVDATNGNDLNDGLSPETAWKTIGKVNNSWTNINSGEDILLKRGGIFTDARLRIQKGGIPDNYLVIGAYGGGEKPIIDCSPNDLRGGISCNIANLSYITIQDLCIKDAVSASGISIGADNLSNITISCVEVDNSDNNGIVLLKVDKYIIENCIITNCVNSGIAIMGSSTYPVTNGIIRNNIVNDITGNDGITLHKNGEGFDIGPNHRILNNVCFRCAEQGLDLTSGSHLIVRGNETFNNGDSGVLVGNVTDIWIDKHYSHSERKMGIIIGGASNVKLTSSIIYNSYYHALALDPSTKCKDFKAYNNTIVYGPNSIGSIIDINSRCHNVTFKNNIITSTKFSLPGRYVRYLGGATPKNTNSDFSHNIWWRPDSAVNDDRLWYDAEEGLYNFDMWKLLYSQGKGSMLINPQLMNEKTADFHLKAKSPCIEAGIDIGLDSDFKGTEIPQGDAPDIGAYEYIKKKKKILIR